MTGECTLMGKRSFPLGVDPAFSADVRQVCAIFFEKTTVKVEFCGMLCNLLSKYIMSVTDLCYSKQTAFNICVHL